MKSKILIPGISGLLGLNLAFSALSRWDVIGTIGQHRLSTDQFASFGWQYEKPGDVKRLVEETHPDLVVNCIAVANLETAEKEPDLAWRLNAELPGEFAAACSAMGIPLIQLSTDAVFDGQKGNYTEDDLPNPINTYARTKLAGEAAVQANNPDAIIARVNFYGWSLSGRRSLCEFWFNNLRDGNPLKGTTDLFYNPMMASDLADTLLEMAEKKLHGIYHVSVADQLSKYEFGCRLAAEFGLNPELIEEISWKELDFRADRSPNLTLAVEKVVKALGHPLPDVGSGLNRLHWQLDSGYASAMQKLGSGIVA